MKLTPLDIHHKEFRHSLRGYSEEEVDAFLDEVADEFERLFKENIDLNEKLEAMEAKVREFEQMEKTVHNTLVAAQKSAEDIEANATKEADLTRKDAELRAKEIIHEALSLKQKTQNEFMRIKQAETDFRQNFRALLERHLGEMSEIAVPSDIQEMSERDEQAEEIVASMDSMREPEPEAPVAPAPAPEPVAGPVEPPPASPQPVPEPVEEAPEVFEASAVIDEPALIEEPGPSVAVEDDAPAPVAEPPESGFVTSVHLGEVGESGIAEEEPLYDDEPAEFEIPTFDSLGERDDDLDIEEID
jgi:cell division initiation protein